jgi:hypothetical protein
MQGARKLAHYVAREITRLLASRSALIGADHAIGTSLHRAHWPDQSCR